MAALLCHKGLGRVSLLTRSDGESAVCSLEGLPGHPEHAQPRRRSSQSASVNCSYRYGWYRSESGTNSSQGFLGGRIYKSYRPVFPKPTERDVTLSPRATEDRCTTSAHRRGGALTPRPYCCVGALFLRRERPGDSGWHEARPHPYSQTRTEVQSATGRP